MAAAAQDTRLTDLESAWFAAAAPVLVFAREQRLPLDIVVQPQPRGGDAPLAMGFVNGRCKLVLTMRGGPDASTGKPDEQTALEGVAPDLVALLQEAMTAHEIGHCWRYVNGVWHTLPAGFVDTSERPWHLQAQDTPGTLAAARRDMRQTRREEGFADLVGLAWTHSRHPLHYARVHAWFVGVRDAPALPGSHHDTRAWLRLAANPAVFGPAADPFEQARRVWQRGLLDED